jgi:hypothetical protein
MYTLDIATDPKSESIEFEKLTWLDTTEAAIYLRKTANALRIMVNRGYIKPRRFRRRLYFRKVELDRLIESLSFSNCHSKRGYLWLLKDMR